MELGATIRALFFVGILPMPAGLAALARQAPQPECSLPGMVASHSDLKFAPPAAGDDQVDLTVAK